VIVLDSPREVRVRAVLHLLPWAVVGLIFGTEVLRVLDPTYIRLSVGVLVVLFAALLLREVALPGIGGRWGTVIAGASSGVLSTSTGLAGPPVVLLFAARGFTKGNFRVSNAAYFLFRSAAALTALYLRGLVEVPYLWIAASLIPAAFAGKVLGTSLAGRVSNESFRKITLGVTALTGVLGVVTAAFALA
jgi:uncharacterized membrane protein YfcA